MIAPAIPEHESSRLADLLELSLLDTPPEARFDRIVSGGRACLDEVLECVRTLAVGAGLRGRLCADGVPLRLASA